MNILCGENTEAAYSYVTTVLGRLTMHSIFDILSGKCLTPLKPEAAVF
jgi:hypothetical protein